MAPQSAPKVILFDIGGVVVLSPLQGIIDFERKNGIPTDWINYAIRYKSPNGHWQRLERGEIPLDAAFFEGFTADLHNKTAWKEFHSSFRNEKKKLKDTANPTQLGDHVSLKAEAADSKPTDQDKGAQAGPPAKLSSKERPQTEGKPSLSKLAKDTTIGDPVSLESEEVAEGGDSSASKPRVTSSGTGPASTSSGESSLPAMPSIDGEKLFWSMMSTSREPDPYVFPAVQRLSKQKARPILGALSNTVIYPPDHPWSDQNAASEKATANGALSDPRSLFDVFVASAEVGMRKPARDIYELAVERLDMFDKEKGGNGVKPLDIVFLDDIGENLKTAKELGMKTIRVQLGKTWRAVKELEAALGGGVELMDEKTRRSKL
ncbi:hypothetical protein ACLMJK_002372 [Lecanora helva]